MKAAFVPSALSTAKLVVLALRGHHDQRVLTDAAASSRGW